jgi:hypothetical protein
MSRTRSRLFKSVTRSLRWDSSSSGSRRANPGTSDRSEPVRLRFWTFVDHD